MKLLLTLLFAFTLVFAQKNRVDNYTIQRLIIFNNDNQILLEENKFGWFTPALRHNKQQSLNEGLDSLINEFGIKVTRPSLKGYFTFKFNFKSTISFRSHYVSQYISGNIKRPSNSKNVRWVSLDEAYKLMTKSGNVSENLIRDMTFQVINNPNELWGGTFLIERINEKYFGKMIEGFYPINPAPEINSPVIRLTIINDRNEILIRKTKYGWMTPAIRLNKKLTIQETLTNLALKYNIKIHKPKLVGLFTYSYTFKKMSDTRQLYLANYQSGTPTSPSNEKVAWMEKNEALKRLQQTLPSLAQMTKQIMENPKKVWGGAFILSKEDEILTSKQKEAFHILN